MTIEEAIRTVLVEAAGVYALVDERVYPIQAPASATFPLIVYQEADQQSVMTYSGPKKTSRYSMDLTIWGTSVASVKAVRRQVRDTLIGHRGTQSTIRVLGVFDDNENDDHEIPQSGDERGLFGVTLSVTLWFRDTAA